MNKHVLILGNPTDPQDDKAQQLVNEHKHLFPHLTFIPWDPTEELPREISTDIVLIDAIQGISKATVFHSLDDFILSPRNTVHDFDLPVALKLLQKLGKITSITIIGIPYEETHDDITNQLVTILQSI